MKTFRRIAWATVMLAGGCTALLGVDDDYRPVGSSTSQGGGATTAASTSTTTGAGGQGGGGATTVTSTATGNGGSGGVGGQGGASTAATSTSTGGVMCVGETGTGVIADCDQLNITPPSHGGPSKLCGDAFDKDPPGYGLCTRGFGIFTTGAASSLVQCLATIGVQDACNLPPLDACIDTMYAALCESAAIKADCGDIKASCGADPLDAVQCAKDLIPLNEAGVMQFGKCMNDADPSLLCQQAYDACYAQVFNF